MTAAQAAQQENRDRGGRYAEQAHADPGSSVLGGDPVQFDRVNPRIAPLGIDDRIAVEERIANALYVIEHDPRQGHPALEKARAALTMDGPNTREGFKTWTHRHNGKLVDTVQVTVKDGELRQVWTPGERKLNAGPTYISWGEENSRSRRDFAGVRALHSTDTRMVGWDDHMGVLVCYEVN